jgi:Holliday junction resolvasome RuvABC ATP-dependent DNA helicase subunit
MKTELFTAAETGNISALRTALGNGADINQVDENGATPLIIACKFGHTALVKFILSRGAKIDLADNKGMTAVKNAELSNKTELIELFKNSVGKYSTDDDNASVKENFNNILDNLLPVSQQIQPIVKGLSEEQRMEIKGDLIKIISLFKGDEAISLYDGFGYGLSILVLYYPDTYTDFFTNIKQLNESQQKNFVKDVLDSEGKYFENSEVSLQNFVLESTDILSSSNADKMKKAFYEFAEIIVKGDGVVTEQETKILKFLSKSFFKEQKNETKPLQAKEFSKNELDTILEELNSLVGMENIKSDIHSLINIINVNKLRTKEGLPEQKLSLHSVFIGPPGTGKTTIARILSNIYHSLELLPENNFVETDRSGLVAGYVGQTAIKTDNIITQAKNGILFIDEAYTLKRSNSDNDYGQEAIDILLKRMEDFRGNLIIIVAGYETEMNYFINSNPGLKSRFNRYFHFKDYDSTELTEIYKRIADKSGFILKDEALKTLHDLFEKLCSAKDDKFGNARLARNIFEKTFEKHANRTSYIAPITREILTTIEAADIPVEEFSTN